MQECSVKILRDYNKMKLIRAQNFQEKITKMKMFYTMRNKQFAVKFMDL